MSETMTRARTVRKPSAEMTPADHLERAQQALDIAEQAGAAFNTVGMQAYATLSAAHVALAQAKR